MASSPTEIVVTHRQSGLLRSLSRAAKLCLCSSDAHLYEFRMNVLISGQAEEEVQKVPAV